MQELVRVKAGCYVGWDQIESINTCHTEANQEEGVPGTFFTGTLIVLCSGARILLRGEQDEAFREWLVGGLIYRQIEAGIAILGPEI